ncbi:hypothetical protein [Chlorogloea sp. CCALA 695]|nr:hypothetical protein [Chlorogloea sp. CCALA 695]
MPRSEALRKTAGLQGALWNGEKVGSDRFCRRWERALLKAGMSH